jgi:hypothetical protein
MRREPIDQPDGTVRRTKQKPPSVRRDAASIEAGDNFAAFHSCKTEQVWGTVCLHRVILGSELNRCGTTIFSDSGPDAQDSVRYPGQPHLFRARSNDAGKEFKCCYLTS